MKKAFSQIVTLFLVTVLGFITHSCDLNDFTYQGPSVVEFSGETNRPGYSYTWLTANLIWSGEIQGNSFPDTSVTVALVGPQQGFPQKIGFYVADRVYRDINTSTTTLTQPDGEEGSSWVVLPTTAVEGVDFQILNNGEGVIPANSSFGRLPISVTPTGDRFLYVVMTERDLKPSENYKIFRLRIRN